MVTDATGGKAGDGTVKIAIDGRGAMAGRTSIDISLPGLNFGPAETAGAAEGAARSTDGALSSDTANAEVGAALTVAALGASGGKPAADAVASALWANASLGAE